MQKAIYLTLLFATLISCNSSKKTTAETKEISIQAKDFHQANLTLEKAIINDYFSPPVASRIYLYPNLSAYECFSIYTTGSSRIVPLTVELNKSSKEDIVPEIASLYAFYTVGKEFVYSSDIVSEGFNKWEKELLNSGISKDNLSASKAFGIQVAQSVLARSRDDNYAEQRSAGKYELMNGKDKWKPTPPDYLDALEPEWENISSISLDSSSQFRCEPPTPFSLDVSSQYYRELMEVYNAVNSLKEDQPNIAKFWDCNPIVPKHQGHVTIAEKKLTPGGHWMNIAREAMKDKKFSFLQSVKTYTYTSIGIFEAFISCWEAKYHYSYIRPVTVIQEKIDPDWSPILLTPNFPEYPSGHSVVSGSASTILTKIIGENYHFTDESEVPFGMKPRTFDSFSEAADEAAISRLYGGIHYIPAIVNGVSQGRKVGKHIVNKFLENEPF